METSNLKNMVILKNLPSNIVDEAIIVLKSNKKIKKTEKIENKRIRNSESEKKDKDYILKEAEIIINNYISKLEKKDDKKILNNEIKKKYGKLKKYSWFMTAFCVIEALIIIF